jgi:hypothetical protein
MALHVHGLAIPGLEAPGGESGALRRHCVPQRLVWQWAAALSLALLAAAPAAAQTALHCERGTVALGDSAFAVTRACGPADAVSASVIERGIVYDARGQAQIGAVLGERRRIVRERWEYAGSRGRLTRTLLFEDGILIDLRLGGYGR